MENFHDDDDEFLIYIYIYFYPVENIEVKSMVYITMPT